MTLESDDETREASRSWEDGVRDARPGPTVDLAEVQARAAQALFGAAEPARVGRFVILDRIGAGGMGVVYGAYDPQLDRRVALKVLPPSVAGTRHARDRLIREARALARLDHPNVVPVHDVMVVQDQVAIVMELVGGKTLAAWERERARGWREVLDIYIEAGRGLAAVHRIGVVHRDFKPANVIVGDDGRVRVLDFGLARVGDDEPSTDVREGAPHPSVHTLTGPGDVVGTRAYMSPEQLGGRDATAESDQFSFCVALHRALHNVPPFAGLEIAELQASIAAGEIRHGASSSKVPRRLRAIVARGLANDPAARHPSIQRLLDELDRLRARRRWGAAGAVSVAGIAVVAALGFNRGGTSAPACDGGTDDLAAVWNPARHADLQRSLDALGTPLAAEAATHILPTLDAYATAWQRTHLDACTSHRKGTQSADILDRRMLCLHRRLGDLRGAVTVLGQLDAATVTNAPDVAAGLPPLADCSDLEVLASDALPPPTADARRQVSAIRDQISRASALYRGGRSQDALDLIRLALADAQRVGYPSAIIEAALVQGRILLWRRELPDALTALSLAQDLALEHGPLRSAVEAAARRIYVLASDQGIPDDVLQREIAWAEPLSRGLRGDRFARPLLLMNVGTAYRRLNHAAEARGSFEAAQAAMSDIDDPDLELTNISINLAMTMPPGPDREALVRSVWERRRDRLGPANLETLDGLAFYASLTEDAGAARRLMDDLCDQYGRFHPQALVLRTEYCSAAAFLAEEVGDAEGAAVRYASVVDMAAGAADRDVLTLGTLAAGSLALRQQRPADALRHFTAVIGERSAIEDLGEAWRAAPARLGAGMAEIALGHRPEAAAHLEAAARLYERLSAENGWMENHRRLARTRATLASIVRTDGRAGR